MAVFPRPARPSVLWADLKAFLRQRERHQLVIGALAVLMPLLIIYGFLIDADDVKPQAQIVYAQSWPANRTDAEIVKQNVADQKILDAQKREKQRQYQRLAKQLGIE